MKKKLIFLGVIGAMLCALPFVFKAPKANFAHAVNTEQEEVVKDDKWTKEDVKEILGYLGIGAGGVSTALAFYIPIYLKVKKAQKDIVEAKTGIVSEKKNNEDVSKKLEESEKNLKQQKHDFDKSMKHTDEMLSLMNKKLNEIEQICKLGFINNKELVSKGVATTISKVGQDEEHKG